MKLKLDENGNPVVKYDCPVFINAKNEEVKVDIPELYKMIVEQGIQIAKM